MDNEIKVAVDAVIFGFCKESGINILLIKRKYPPFINSWALPGGFILNNESLEDAVSRELREETGITINYLEQLYTFGSPKRDPRSRIISVAYFGLVNSNKYKKLKANTDAVDAKWINLNNLSNLGFDHEDIIKKAVERLRNKIQYEPIGFELLEKQFAFSDLENLYSKLLNKKIDRRNFKKKIMSFGVIIESKNYAPKKGAGRPGKLYSFDKKQYHKLKKKGIYFEI